ncbi:uncharacterized protein BO96DRAFT_429728 [Aspergillus niger CBS 101883]|uniref:uncharacterized protein n=1 Tax=Aspergillus lacticoffeatus (strain CBS 101883) TaxID=1450533 RepID=UPI000D7FB95D|nr:uncharacterized protein BO96DRAFT_429728 [Aspergillus niger CBS 101883]PYH61073.1 hypothetical protein BO96DRAFT_429728 [Aspergillus niger CBS 101883]
MIPPPSINLIYDNQCGLYPILAISASMLPCVPFIQGHRYTVRATEGPINQTTNHQLESMGEPERGNLKSVLDSNTSTLTMTYSTTPIDVLRDAERVFEVIKNQGIALIPGSIGYGLVASDPAALDRLFTTKRRKPHKKHAMIGSYALHQEIHVLPAREESMVRTLTVDLDVPVGVAAPFRADHPIIQKLGPELLSRCTHDGTLSMLVNGGPLQDELIRLCHAAGLPLLGSSANISGSGMKVRLEDIEPEIVEAADIVIDYGKRTFSVPRASSTIINFRDMKLVRYGACYDVIQDVLRKFYGVELPEDPGKDELFSGHIDVQQATVY